MPHPCCEQASEEKERGRAPRAELPKDGKQPSRVADDQRRSGGGGHLGREATFENAAQAQMLLTFRAQAAPDGEGKQREENCDDEVWEERPVQPSSRVRCYSLRLSRICVRVASRTSVSCAAEVAGEEGADRAAVFPAC